MQVGLKRKLSAEELMLLNCDVGEDFSESVGQQGDQTNLPKENQAWILIRRTDAEAEALILSPPDVKSWLFGKDPDAGKDWRQEEKGTTEDEMLGWHHRLDGHEFEQILGDSEEQRSLACCSPWGRKELEMIEWLNWACPFLRARLSHSFGNSISIFHSVPTCIYWECRLLLFLPLKICQAALLLFLSHGGRIIFTPFCFANHPNLGWCRLLVTYFQRKVEFRWVTTRDKTFCFYSPLNPQGALFFQSGANLRFIGMLDLPCSRKGILSPH